MGSVIRTERLMLRPWREGDLGEFARMNADGRVMEWLPGVLSRGESEAMVGRIRAQFEERGFGLWAVEVVGGAEFVGFVGLSVVGFDGGIVRPGEVEVGWRLGWEHWGKGYATEGARGAIAFAFGEVGLKEVVSFTAEGNERSRRVMERVGMRYVGEFEHPRLGVGDRLRRHVLYRIERGGKISEGG